MPFFKFKDTPLSSPVHVFQMQEVVFNAIDDVGFVISDVSVKDVDVSSPEYVSGIPSRDEYTFENLLASGVPLNQVDTSHFLDNTDVAVLGKVANARLSSIVEDIKNKDVESVEPVNE